MTSFPIADRLCLLTTASRFPPAGDVGDAVMVEESEGMGVRMGVKPTELRHTETTVKGVAMSTHF